MTVAPALSNTPNQGVQCGTWQPSRYDRNIEHINTNGSWYHFLVLMLKCDRILVLCISKKYPVMLTWKFALPWYWTSHWNCQFCHTHLIHPSQPLSLESGLYRSAFFIYLWNICSLCVRPVNLSYRTSQNNCCVTILALRMITGLLEQSQDGYFHPTRIRWWTICMSIEICLTTCSSNDCRGSCMPHSY